LVGAATPGGAVNTARAFVCFATSVAVLLSYRFTRRES